ncbi:MAG: bifunctional (p)ppGpp synthetase/guanosine-3',5'-bis(diphosphate) 3'-pyrophosphohydrolase [Cyanobacteria bacterium SZAS-4]|nr:bifunctional (p)ppGpp synthetase/guanosine-3',5'-bis(diphosphate) 3'-pyrophosphohydrolase [Cyanobacteria bacterium SZAS-4]
MKDLAMLFEALDFAASKHQFQRRKGSTETPYINHPIDVARRLVGAGEEDPQVLIAAILHDTVEDTETTFDQIATKFGAEVASLVKECTDDKSLPKAERKRLQIENAPHKSRKAKCIKIADKISNVADMKFHAPPDWSLEQITDYLTWTEQVVRGLSGVNEILESEFAQAVAEARKAHPH